MRGGSWFRTVQCRRLFSLYFLFCLVCTGEPDRPDVIDVSEAATPPVPITTTQPEYTEEARVHRVEGSVLLAITISPQGAVSNIRVLRPLGFGLDEAAVAAVSRWKFKPATKSGMPQAVHANAVMSYRLLDRATEAQQTRLLEDVLAELARTKSAADPGAAEAVRKLKALADSQESSFPAAQVAMADLYRKGTLIAADAREETRLLTSAAAMGYVPAMSKLGMMLLDGDGAAKDEAKGLEMLSQAARFGDLTARRVLASRLEMSDPVAALGYYRGCGSQGDTQCQFRAGMLLVGFRDAGERKEAAAWLLLAQGNGVAEAEAALDRFAPPLTDQEKALAEKLARSLVADR